MTQPVQRRASSTGDRRLPASTVDGRRDLVRVQRLGDAAQPLQDVEVGFGSVVASLTPSSDPLAQQRQVGAAMQDRERRGAGSRQGREPVALGAAQEGGVDEGRPAAAEHRPGDREQARIGQLGRGGAVDAAANAVARGLERRDAEEALALDVRADAHGADRLGQRLRHESLARSGQSASDRQPRVVAAGERAGEPQIPERGAARGIVAARAREARRPRARTSARLTRKKRSAGTPS